MLKPLLKFIAGGVVGLLIISLFTNDPLSAMFAWLIGGVIADKLI
jgi:hypothetical protein